MDTSYIEPAQPMSWEEYKRLGPHRGPRGPRDVAIGALAGVGLGAMLGYAFPAAAGWSAIGGAVVGGTIGTISSIYKNQMEAYEQYLARFKHLYEEDVTPLEQECSVMSPGHDVAPAPSMREGGNGGRLRKESQHATVTPSRQ